MTAIRVFRTGSRSATYDDDDTVTHFIQFSDCVPFNFAEGSYKVMKHEANEIW